VQFGEDVEDAGEGKPMHLKCPHAAWEIIS
jgi:hypothetical protein